MLVDVVMPKMGESIMEGTILEWRKKVGDPVEKDELFLEIGTDKVDSEIPSLESGIIVEILAQENDVVDVGTVIARIETDESLVDISSPSKKPIKTPEPEPINVLLFPVSFLCPAILTKYTLFIPSVKLYFE